MKSDKIIKWLWLKLDAKIPPRKGLKLYDAFGSIDALYASRRSDLEQLPFLKTEDIDKLCSKACPEAEACLKIMNDENISLITIDMEIYPRMLAATGKPPYLLFVRGKMLNLNEYLCIGVVGTRNPTVYGQRMTYSLSKGIASCGAVIVSGMALGVDTIAHCAAVDAGVPTVAVLGSGVDVISPRANEDLYNQIAETGMIISEYPLSTVATNYTFPERNRIIAGISSGLAVTEADVRSGSLITADYALKYGRDVFAVPGNIDSDTSQGTNELIKHGAYVLTEADDIIQFFYGSHSELIENGLRDYIYSEDDNSGQESENHDILPMTDENLPYNDKILASLSQKPLTVDQISYITHVPLAELNVAVLMLEMEGKIRKTEGIYYTLA